ncbi:MAG: desulfoferrodoxin FeS4 iron-binding domain-containing protein [Arcobacter butzleri]|jgi:desulfoferrodoxin-like iron-binding protein|nr:desulfoferrodoxin FeS4 iron-binding domain-containing protein [Arcobacteraceae bacterium]MDY0365705.1 ferritin family protein [Arcobacteraceae bacterium]NLO17987.1 desulfoferrodoxin FeS4 iron-binding domain-containing protein [Aliarcobacter butzleri]
MRKYETYRCNKCGNEVEVQVVGGGKLVCCGEHMECITTNLTAVNLMKAFAGESQARNKYEFFADVAFEEGYHRIARFFQEAADNEKYHAMAEYKAYNKLVLDVELDTTVKNLVYAADGERYEHEIMYPEFEAIANEEGYKEIARMLKAIGKVEVEHEREYLELKAALEAEGFFNSDEDEEWVCEVCGHVHRGKKAPKACPLCRVDQEYFKKRSKDITVG